MIDYRSPQYVNGLAFFIARREAKQRLRDQGHKLMDIPPSEISQLAKLLQPSFIEKAREWCEQWEQDHQRSASKTTRTATPATAPFKYYKSCTPTGAL